MGGAHQGGRYRVAQLVAAIPSGRAINPVTETNWEGTGVEPDIEVRADQAYNVAYRLALDHVLALGSNGPRRDVAQEAAAARAELGDR